MDDGTESLGVLGKILGDQTVAAQANENGFSDARVASGTIITEEDVEGDFDFGGLSLREFVARGDVRGEGGEEIHRSQTVEECMWIPLSVVFLASISHLPVLFSTYRSSANGKLEQINATKQDLKTFTARSGPVTTS